GADGAGTRHAEGSARHEQPFRQPAPLAFLGQPHQPVRLQRVQMVVDLLPGQADPRGKRRRRGRRDELGEESTPHGLQGHRRRRRIIDDLDGEHDEMVALTTIIVKAGTGLFLRNSRSQWRAATGEVATRTAGKLFGRFVEFRISRSTRERRQGNRFTRRQEKSCRSFWLLFTTPTTTSRPSRTKLCIAISTRSTKR